MRVFKRYVRRGEGEGIPQKANRNEQRNNNMSHVPSKNRIVLYIKFHSKRPGVGKRSFL